MLILVNRAEEKLSVHREIAKFLTVYRVCYTPIETLTFGHFLFFHASNESIMCFIIFSFIPTGP